MFKCSERSIQGYDIVMFKWSKKNCVSKLFLSSSDIIAGINQGNRLVEFWFPERNLLGKVKSKSYKKKKSFSGSFV